MRCGICWCGVVVLLAVCPAAQAQDKADLEEVKKADLAKMQGKWELLHKDGNGNPIRSVKEIKGNKTFLTRYNDKGEVFHAHTSELELTVTDRVRIHTWRIMEVTAGPNKGDKYPGPAAYIYTIDDSSWTEVWGLLRGDRRPPAMFVWKRVKAAE